MKVLKKTLAVAAAVSLVCLSSVGAMAANKLIVKDSSGTNDVFVVTDSGYIGQGTSAPAYPIHIVSPGIPSKSQLFFYNTGRTAVSAGDSPAILLFRNNVASVDANLLPRNGDRLGMVVFGSVVNGANQFLGAVSGFAEGTWTTSSAPTYVSFAVTPSGSLGAVERVRIASTGNVGIGTTAPAQKLDVSGGIRLNSTGSKPTCNSGNRGTFWITQGTTDVLEVCAQVSGGYAWHGVTLN